MDVDRAGDHKRRANGRLSASLVTGLSFISCCDEALTNGGSGQLQEMWRI